MRPQHCFNAVDGGLIRRIMGISILCLMATGTPLAAVSAPAVSSQPIAIKQPGAAPVKNTTVPPPALIEMKTARSTYRNTDDVMIQLKVLALVPLDLCVSPDQPEANVSLKLWRAGYGPLDIPAQVVQLNPKKLHAIQKTHLEVNQTYHLSVNLKKLVPLAPPSWKTGEYRIQALFYPCGALDAEKGLSIPVQGPLHLLILE